MAFDHICIFYFTQSFQVYLQLNLIEKFDQNCGTHLMTKFVGHLGRIVFFQDHFLDLCHVDLLVIVSKRLSTCC